MHNENKKPLCWLPNAMAENVKQAQINTAIYRILKAGLWNVPEVLVKENFDKLADPSAESLLKDFTPGAHMRHLVFIHSQSDHLFMIVNEVIKMEQNLPQKFTEKFTEKFSTLMGNNAQDFCSKISFKFASIAFLLAHTNFIKPLLHFNGKSEVGCCSSSGEPWNLTVNMSGGGSASWGFEKGGLIFVSEQPLSELFFQEKNSTKNQYNQEEILLKGDALRADLPILEENILTDVNKGHWDLFQPENISPENISQDISAYDRISTQDTYMARNPLRDVQSNSLVSIDFGTSSTVVAIRNEDRSVMLERIGMQAQAQTVEAKHFENPTVLEFLDYTSFMERWTAVPYKPLTRWSDVCCAHKAKNEICNTGVDSKVVNSGLTSLKTWARRTAQEPALRLRDQQDVEIHIPPLRNDANAHVNVDYNAQILNPIELYAYFIGLHLNNQVYYGGRIFQEYYLTFPIKFNRETRDGILTSFKRGLMRSLPPALAFMPNWLEDNFIVEEHASEPTAYAAAALSSMPDMQATEEGIAFGVFDFGGGTTDFSFGLYRLATTQEHDQDGYEEVLDILDTAGDEDLGGEHLLLGMASLVIENNVQMLIEKNIPFTFPAHTHFLGLEALRDFGSIAQCNTTKLSEMLRSFWEEGTLSDEGSGKISCTFFSKSNATAENIALSVSTDDLEDYLIKRISQGVKAFFTAFAQAFKIEEIKHAEKLHVLLAGNSCRSPLVKQAFENVLQEIREQKDTLDNIRDVIVLHDPLLGDEQQVNSPNMKTGVALGLLKIAPGEALGVVDRSHSAEESPFRYTVGRFVLGKLQPTLQRNATYGQWHELGKVRTSLMDIIGFSLLPDALEGNVSQEFCENIRHKWDKKHVGKKIFIKAHAPDTIALTVADDVDSIDNNLIITYSLI